MASIIIIENGISSSKLERIVESMHGIAGASISVITNDDSLSLKSAATVSMTDSPISDQIWKCINDSSDNQTMIIDGRIDIDPVEVQSMLETASNSAVGISAISSGENSTDIDDIAGSTLINHLSSNSQWPLALIAINKSQIGEINQFQSASTTEFMAKLIISAIGDSLDICAEMGEITIDPQSFEDICSLGDALLSEMLRHAINSVNIEELFPNHAWPAHGNECAAACYHTLSAHFINLGDYDSALECLGLSDQLEDSPRSLALKGLIALNRGETLQAVANMVSSLQEYEKRKTNEDSEHYLTFIPKDLEKVNLDLKSGLEALNQRDNNSALNHFADAVFQFDSFFDDLGLKRPEVVIN